MSSQPYGDLPPVPPGTTLKALLDEARKTGSLGRLHFADKPEAERFVGQQERLARESGGATDDQLRTLVHLRDTGKLPDSSVSPAPPGTTVEALLTPSSSTPDKDGFYHFGALRVEANLMPQFVAAKRTLCAKDPEALAVSYHLENGARPASIMRAGNGDFQDGTSISWDPTKASVEPSSGSRQPSEITLLHESTHALGGFVGATLAATPSARFDNLEEKRVVLTTEARGLRSLGLEPRQTHGERTFTAPDVTSTKNLGTTPNPQLHVTADGKEFVASSGYTRSDRITSLDEGKGDLFNQNGAHGDPESAIRQAFEKGDTLKIQVGRDGQITWEAKAPIPYTPPLEVSGSTGFVPNQHLTAGPGAHLMPESGVSR